MTTEPQYTIEYRGYIINIHQDTGPSNPWEDWDCLPPIIVQTPTYGYTRDQRGYGDTPFPVLSKAQISQHAKALCEQTGTSSLLNLITEHNPYGRTEYSASEAVEAVNDALGRYKECLSQADLLPFLQKMNEWAGIQSLQTTVTGYSQGAWADILITITPEFLKEAGFPPGHKFTEDEIQSYADLYAAWAYGDVYSYITEDQAGEEIDSCGGFYGSDHEKSGLVESATSEINYYIAYKQKVKARKLKELIRHHVPLTIRQDILSAI